MNHSEKSGVSDLINILKYVYISIIKYDTLNNFTY